VPPPVRLPEHLLGAVLVAVSAAAFGAMAILGVWAHEDGTDTWPLLFVRFALAAVVLLVLVRARGIGFPPLRRLGALAAMGGLGYVGQSYCYFTALQHAQASTVALLLYLYPVLVAVLAAVFLRERLSTPVVVVLVVSLLGTTLVIGAGSGQPKGIVLAISAAFIYSVYITAGSRATAGVHPFVVALVVCSSAAMVCGAVVLLGLARGAGVRFPQSPPGWGAAAAIALVCTVVAIVTFFAGMERLGPTRTAVLSTLEPVVTAILAVTLLAESLSRTQLLGGVLVLSAVAWHATRGGSHVHDRDQDVPLPAQGH
jgi:drug/metabolite transporter (DMT)-like permease